MPTDSLPELGPDDLATVSGALGLRNAAYAGFVAASFFAGQPAGPMYVPITPIAPATQTIGAR